jgi:hypothetical protein
MPELFREGKKMLMKPFLTHLNFKTDELTSHDHTAVRTRPSPTRHDFDPGWKDRGRIFYDLERNGKPLLIVSLKWKKR